MHEGMRREVKKSLKVFIHMRNYITAVQEDISEICNGKRGNFIGLRE